MHARDSRDSKRSSRRTVALRGSAPSPAALPATAVALGALGYFLQYSWFFVSRVKRIDQLSDAAHVPMWIPHSAVLVGFGLIALMLMLRALRPAKPAKQDF